MPLVSSPKTKILLLSEETPIASFILDVLSSVDYEVLFSEDLVFHHHFSPMILIVNLESPFIHNQSIEKLQLFYSDALFIGFSSQPLSSYSPIIQKTLAVCLDIEHVRLQLMSHILKLKEVFLFKNRFKESLKKLVGNSEPMQVLYKKIEQILPHKGTVLIQGESGVGKELVARAIASVQPHLIIVNCSAIPENLFESELFGHTRGAFTGASVDRVGLFEEADNGALFLDEIGDMPLAMQTKLLRALQEGEIRRVGSNITKKVSVRLIAATNRNLKEEVQKGRFREDLFYRLNVIPIEVPSLKERIEDIEDLSNHFIKKYAPPSKSYSLSKEALAKLKLHDWPGNIRELENTIHRAISFTETAEIQVDNIIIDHITSNKKSNGKEKLWNGLNYIEFKKHQLEEEREFIRQKFLENDSSITKTAAAFGMLRTALHNRATRIGLQFRNIEKENDSK